jgi:hypothetical protein
MVCFCKFSLQTLVVIREGSGVGRGCVALIMHVASKGRALPLVWHVRQDTKGPWPEAMLLARVEPLYDLSPLGARVVLLGDGAGDGIQLQQAVQDDH